MHSRCWLAVLILVPLANPFSIYGQEVERLNDLKQEAAAEVESLRKFTQQAVDQIFSFGELGFQ